MIEERNWHNIKKNEVTRVPVKHVFIDTEAHREQVRGVETQWWRCGVAIYANRKRGGEYTRDSRDYRSPEDLWDDVSDFAGSTGRTIGWAHNLGYDVRIADMLNALPRRGWTLVGHNIANRGTWLEWKRDKSTLVFCDSYSVYPTSIEQIGQWFSLGKPQLPDDGADMGTWLDRCRADCSILATAIIKYLQWIKEEDLGCWQITGNSQSWATFRHKFLTHKMTVHANAEALAAERKAMWTGRCEAYWHGEMLDQRIYEYDFTRAHPTIARDYELPVKLAGRIDNGDRAFQLIKQGKYAVLAEVSVTTDVPVVPTSHEGRILWPTGTFETTLWDVEIQAAVNAGAKVEIRHAWIYHKAPALRAWGEWILGALDSDDNDVPAWKKGVLKHWSRALIGRMAMTYRKWEWEAELPESTVESGWFKGGENGEVKEFVQVGHSMWTLEGREEWKHSMPMITGYVQAVARVQLWDVLRRMPFRSTIYADTDSVFVTQEFIPEVEEIAASIPSGVLRLKRVWEGIGIYGPRQIITGQEVRISGIPKRAQRIEKKVFEGEVWESVGSALRFGHTAAVHIRERRWTVTGVDRRRKGTGFGWTEPYEIGKHDQTGLHA